MKGHLQYAGGLSFFVSCQSVALFLDIVCDVISKIWIGIDTKEEMINDKLNIVLY